LPNMANNDFYQYSYYKSVMVYFGDKEPVYTDHALDQLKLRKITKEAVKHCLNNPEVTRPGKNGCIVMQSHYKGKYIKIVVRGDNPALIITAGD